MHFYYLSEQAVTIQFGDKIDERLLGQVTRYHYLIKRYPFPGFREAVPAYATLTVFYDPVTVARSLLTGKHGFEKVCNYLESLESKPVEAIDTEQTIVSIPVCYDQTLAPDLDEVAATHGFTPNQVIQFHTAITYRVFMIGFVPGFAYLGGMDERLTMPRKPVPRAIVPAGSVGIAGGQTGIYPLETPGGWQLIGRTPLNLFNAGRSQPSLLKSGDRVMFKPINLDEYHHLAAATCASGS